MSELLADTPKLFACEVCQKEFNKKSNLRRHLLVHLAVPLPRKAHVCPHCHFNAATPFSLQVHIKRIHTKEFKYVCPLCSKGYVIAGELRKHMRRHHPDHTVDIAENNDNTPMLEAPSELLEVELKEGDPLEMPLSFGKPFQCPHCGKEFVKMKNLEKHLPVHAEDFVEKEHVCPHCSFKACSSSSLCVHIRRIHTKEFKHVCPHCGKGFAIPSELKRHVEFRHAVREPGAVDVMKSREEGLMCEVCNRLFTSPSEIEEHRRKHISMLEVKKHQCTQCDYATNYKGDLKRHMRYHLGERPYRCEICNKAFVEKGPLKIHLRTHTGETPFACTTCGRRFKRMSNLQDHERTHSGDKPYLCDLCSRRFTTRTGLNLHRCRQGGDVVDVLLPEDPELS